MSRFTRIPTSDETRNYQPRDIVERGIHYATNTGWLKACPVLLTDVGEPAGRYGDNHTRLRFTTVQ